MMHADIVQPAAAAAAGNADRFQCELCGKTFRQKRTLANHHLSHTGQRPYECKVCNKRFFWSGSLSRHNRIHTGEKPYKCSVCQKQFTQSGTLNRHLRTHTGEKPYLCKHCPRRFSTNSNLAQHLRTHKKNGTFRASVATAVPALQGAPAPTAASATASPAVVLSQGSNADAVERILAAEYAKPAVVATAVPDSLMVKAAAHVTEAASGTRNSGGLQASNSIAWNHRPSPSTPHKPSHPLTAVPASMALQPPPPPLASKLDEPVSLNMDPFPCGPEMASLGQMSGMPYFNASTLTMEPLGSLTPMQTPNNPKSPVYKALPSALTRNQNQSSAASNAANLRCNGSPRSNAVRLWDMEKNVVVGGDGMFECMWCNVRCPQREQLLNHFLTHFGEIS